MIRTSSASEIAAPIHTEGSSSRRNQPTMRSLKATKSRFT
jgi:hypothetical protein